MANRNKKLCEIPHRMKTLKKCAPKEAFGKCATMQDEQANNM